MKEIRGEKKTTTENESGKNFRGKGSRPNVEHGISPVKKEGPIPALVSSFGNSAIREILTRGFAPPPHDGFALIEKRP
jgi:hypothetical protein